MALSKAKRSAAAKKAARTRKRRAAAKKASAAGKKAENRYAKKLKKEKKLVLRPTGIPDIITYHKKELVFYEIKPHLQRRGYKDNSSWKESTKKQRTLNKNQKRVFKQLVKNKIPVYIVYYYRKRTGTKTNPSYEFKYHVVKLREKHFERNIGTDPSKMNELKREMKDRDFSP